MMNAKILKCIQTILLIGEKIQIKTEENKLKYLELIDALKIKIYQQ
jgi:hypothetical protein